MSDKKEDSQPSSQQKSDSQPGSSQNAYQTLWQTNEPIDVDAYEPICIKEETLPIITNVESISDPTNAGSTIKKDKAMIDVCKLLVLNGNQSIEKIKEEFKKKYSVSSQDPKIDSEKATTCTSIYIAGMPVWFHFLHMEALIQLNSEFDVDCGSYYIDIFKDTENKQSDKCLIRFVKSRDCLQVYKGLHGIVLIDNDKKMVVNLDLGNEIATVRDNCNPKFEEQLRTFNETRTRLMQNSGQVIDNGASEIIDKAEIKQEVEDDVEFIEPEVSEVIDTDLIQDDPKLDLKDTETTTEISIRVEDDDNNMVDDILNETHKDKEPAESEKSLGDTFFAAESTGCKIVYITNLDTDKETLYYRTIVELISKSIGTVPKFRYRKVMEEKARHRYTGEVLLEFQSHMEAITITEKLDGASSNIAAEGGRIKAVLGVEFHPRIMWKRHKLTSEDLKKSILKRKLEYDKNTNSENQNPAKKTRSDKSPSPSASSECADSTEGVKINVDERIFTTYGLSEEFMLKHKLTMPFSRAVIVTRLHDDVNKAKLKEVFSLAGEVKKIELTKDYAKIEYDHPLEAVQAISMLDGRKLYDKVFFVRMDAVPQSRRLPLGLSGIGSGLGKNGEALRGVRIEAELRRLHEHFVDLGKMERLNAEKFSPFKFTFKHLTPNLIPNRTEAFDTAIDNMIQFKPPNPVNLILVQPNTAQYVRNVAPNTGNLTAPNLNQTVPIPAINGPALGNPTPQQLYPPFLRNPSLPPTSRWPLDPFVLHNVPPSPFFNQPTPQLLNQNRPMYDQYDPTRTLREVPTQPILPQQIPPKQIPPIQIPPKQIPPKQIPPKQISPKQIPPKQIPPKQIPPKQIPPKQIPPKQIPPKQIPPKQISPKQIPPKQIPPKQIPPKQIPPKQIPPKQIPPKQIPPKQIPPKQIPPIQIQPTPVQPIQQIQNNEGKKSEMLVFKNLPPCVTTAILASKMREVGEVELCGLTGEGLGFVRFKHANDADRCIRLFHRSKVDGQVIDVVFL